MRAPALLALLLSIAGCDRADDGRIDVAVIGQPDELFAPGNRLGPAGVLVRSATRQGLVRLDQSGQLVPGLAERWLVTDDGASYIFRIRTYEGPDGQDVTARAVQQALTRTIASLKGTTLGLDLAQVRDVRAMTGRVVEIRLVSPMPGFLQLLAQPELGITIGTLAAGPMTAARTGPGGALLTPIPPEARGMPAQPDWAQSVRSVRLIAGSARALTKAFSDGQAALVLGGTLATLPLADVGPLARGTVRIDPALGLFGLDVRRGEGFLASPGNREALSLALDRPALIQPFNVAGWAATSRVVAPGLPDDRGLVGERWIGLDLAARRRLAASRVQQWRAANGGATPVLSVALPQGPGADILFAGLAAQYREIGLVLARAQDEGTADLALRDRVARYAGARWFLNQFNCRVSDAVCSEDVDFLVQLAVTERDPEVQARYLADAENALAATNAFIPLGAPIRWSLARSGVVGFAENAWAFHPLFALTGAPM